jgi:hypothetical protein
MSACLRVLVACEFSGVVRRAFAARGHDAWSCDLLPAEDRSNRHIVGDARDLLGDGWDLLMVAHPPCTRLCNSGVRWLSEPPRNCPREASAAERADWPGMGREERLAVMWRHLRAGAALFEAFWRAPIPRVAIENPVMNPHAKALLPGDLPRPQIVQPWWFGAPQFKATGFYLRGLPALVPTDRLVPPAPETEAHRAWSAVHRCPPGPERWRIRSRTFPEIAEAMAEQWGGHAAREAVA